MVLPQKVTQPPTRQYHATMEKQWLATNFSGDHLSLTYGHSHLCTYKVSVSPYLWSPQVALCECTLLVQTSDTVAGTSNWLSNFEHVQSESLVATTGSCTFTRVTVSLVFLQQRNCEDSVARVGLKGDCDVNLY